MEAVHVQYAEEQKAAKKEKVFAQFFCVTLNTFCAKSLFIASGMPRVLQSVVPTPIDSLQITKLSLFIYQHGHKRVQAGIAIAHIPTEEKKTLQWS